MNKIISLLLIFLVITTGTLFAKKKKMLPELRRIISVTELTPEMIEDLGLGRMPDVAIECEPGTELSPKLSWHNGIFTALLNPMALLKINKPFYFRVNRKKVYVSRDLIDWEKPGRWLEGKQTTKVKLGDNKSDVLIETNF